MSMLRSLKLLAPKFAVTAAASSRTFSGGVVRQKGEEIVF